MYTTYNCLAIFGLLAGCLEENYNLMHRLQIFTLGTLHFMDFSFFCLRVASQIVVLEFLAENTDMTKIFVKLCDFNLSDLNT